MAPVTSRTGRSDRPSNPAAPGTAGILLPVLLMLWLCTGATAAVHEVATVEQFNAAVEEAGPGDEIVLADGTWLDAGLDIRCSGTAEAPVQVRPVTPGGLVLTGTSWVRISGSHVVLSGIQMRGGARAVAEDGVERLQQYSPIDVVGDFNRVTECAIIDFNPVGREHRYQWVVIRGHGNRVDRCHFRGQDHSGVTVVVNVYRGQPTRALIDHNHFAGKPPLGANGGETIRVGTSGVSMYDSHTVVERNLFENCDGEIEIISNKSCGNIYRHNTFRESAGELTLRHGDRCLVEGNFFLCNGYRGSRGVRIIGRDHRVINNYILEPTMYGIVLQEAVVDSPLGGYLQVSRALVAFNTIIAPGGDAVRLARDTDMERRPLTAVDTTFACNILVGPGRAVFNRAPNPDDITWVRNVAWGGRLGIEDREGITWADPLLQEGEHGLLIPGEGSPARGAGAGLLDTGRATDILFLLANITRDIFGRPRSLEPDAGSVEASEGPVVHRPLAAADVGPLWMR